MQYESVELAYETHGQGTPVVFLHGFPFDHTTWLPLVPYLQDHARLILPDLRGFGRSPAPKGVYTMRHIAEDIFTLLARLELEKAIVVGHSMGGYAALAFAHAYPGHTLGLGLVATQAAADIPERRQARLKTAASVKRRGVGGVVKGMIDRLTPRPELVEPLRALMMGSNPVGVEGALRGMAERPDMTSELSSICAPAVVVVGTADQILTKENVDTMAQMLPLGWLVEIEGGGHMVMMEEPQQVAEALLQMIQKAESHKD